MAKSRRSPSPGVVTEAAYVPDSDLLDPSIRLRYFGGRPADVLASEMPLPPLVAPGLMKLPVGLVRAVTAYAGMDPPPVADNRKGRGRTYVPGPYLHAVVRSLLYMPRFQTQLFTKDGQVLTAPTCPGYTYQNGGFGLYGPPARPPALMIVGKCLGKAEEDTCQPFLGKGSDPLWDAWHEVGMPDRADIGLYVTNVLRYMPPFQVRDKIPPEWFADGSYLLRIDILLSRPKWVLALGADALKAVVGKRGKITEYRGRVTELEFDARRTLDDPPDVFKVNLVAAEHPAFVAREPDAYSSFRSAVRMLRDRAAGDLGVPQLEAYKTPVDYRNVYTADDLDREVGLSVAASQGGGYVSFDCEWEGRHPVDPGSYVYTVQWSHAPGHGRVAFVRRQGGVENPDMPADRLRDALSRLLRGAPKRGAKLVAHFGKADLPWLESLGVNLYPAYRAAPDRLGDEEGPALQYRMGAHDTYVGAHAVAENDDRKLEILCAQVFGVDRWDTPMIEWRDRYVAENFMRKSDLNGYGNAPEDVISLYGCLHRESLVQLGDGSWEQIGRLVRRKYAGKVKAFRDGRVVDADVTGWHRSDADQKDWYRVITATTTLGRWGYTGPVFTPDHRVVTRRGKVRVDSLEIGKDEVLTDEVCFTPDQLSVFLGSILGDGGYTRKHGVGVGFAFGQSARRSGYADWKADVFRNYQPTRRRSSPTSVRYVVRFSRYLESMSQRYPTHGIETHRSRKAVITDDLLQSLGDLGLAVWYQDDGTLVKPQNGRGASRIYCKAARDEVTRVVTWLTRKFGDGVNYNESGKFFQLTGGAFDRFHETIRPYLHPTMSYKTPTPVVSAFRVTGVGAPYFDKVVAVVSARFNGRSRKLGDGVRYCLTVPEAGNFLTKVGFVANCADADYAGRLYLHQNGDPRVGSTGSLDADRYGESSRKIFWVRMRAWAAWAEMERVGLLIDDEQHKRMRDLFQDRRNRLLSDLRAEINWPDFDPNKRKQKIEFLFGEGFNTDSESVRPPGAQSLYLTPYKATKTTGEERLWRDAIAWTAQNGLPAPSPAADAESMIHIRAANPGVVALQHLYGADVLGTALKNQLRPPDSTTPDGEDEWDAGLMSNRNADGRVRSTFGLAETGRGTSSRPNCLLPGAEYKTRTGWVKVEDYDGTADVLQYDPAARRGSYVRPTAVIRNPYDGPTVELFVGESHHMLTVTPDHRVWCGSGRIVLAKDVASTDGFRYPEIAGESDVGEDGNFSYVLWSGNAARTGPHYSGTVYCVTVPSGLIVVRQNGKVSVTGNCQNFSSAVDAKYNPILGIDKDSPEAVTVKSVVRARPGWYIVSADLKGAEIAVAAWMSGDPLLIEHAARANLPESDPGYLDLHSDLANRAFSLNLPLREVKSKYKHLRTAAKRARFGHYYGASADTILRQVQEEAPTVTIDEIRAIVRGHDLAYPRLASLFAACRARVSRPGWIRGPFGGLRRFRPTTDSQILAKMEREAQNVIAQGSVADAMSLALGNLWLVRTARGMRFRIILSTHDSVDLEVPPEELEEVYDDILPGCMSEGVPFTPTDLDGNPTGAGPYHFGIDAAVSTSWGVSIPESEWREAVRPLPA